MAQRAYMDDPKWQYPQQVFVISDLHLGGYVAREGDARPDFRMCGQVGQRKLESFIRNVVLKSHTAECPAHLVINGDFVDFLAESESDDEAAADSPATSQFAPFTRTEAGALAKLRRILGPPRQALARTRPAGPQSDSREDCWKVFDALADLVATPGTWLTILLGNHDLELAWPAALDELAQRIGASEGNVYIRTDGLPLILGELYIDHGNRHDAWNRVNYSALGRATKSGESHRFSAPMGSELVAKYMNRIKPGYSFIDLLKPETAAALPICWFLLSREMRDEFLKDRRTWSFVFRVLWNRYIVGSHSGTQSAATYPIGFSEEAARAYQAVELQADEIVGSEDEWLALEHSLKVELEGRESTDAYFERNEPVESVGIKATGVLDLAHATIAFPIRVSRSYRESTTLKSDVAALADALRALYENNPDHLKIYSEDNTYAQAGLRLMEKYRVVVYGHTHILNRVDWQDCSYFNPGTFADLMLLPSKIIELPIDDSAPVLQELLGLLDANVLESQRRSMPGYVSVTLGTGGVVTERRLTVIADEEAAKRIEIPHEKDAQVKSLWELGCTIDALIANG